MAEQIGNINVDYRSPKITDDLTQQSAGLRAMEQSNLASQIYSRELASTVGAANTASLITQRGAQTSLAERKFETDADLANRQFAVDKDYKYNLINMNRRESERKDAKLPLELAGMDARNWIDQTVAQNNKLKNELLDETMADQIEQQRLQTLTDSSNLQQNRIGTEVARQAVETEKKYLPAYNDFWAGVGDGTIDLETASRPSYGGNVKLNELHDQRVREERGKNAHKIDLETQSLDVKAQSARRNSISPNQRAAYDTATDNGNTAKAAAIMQSAIETNDTFERMRTAHPTASAAVISSLQKGIHPVTKVMGGTAAVPAVAYGGAYEHAPAIPAIPATKKLIDADGNLTPTGKGVAAQQMQALAAQQRADTRYDSTAGSRTAITGQDKVGFASKARLAGEQVDTKYNSATNEYDFVDPAQVTKGYNAIHQVNLNAVQAKNALNARDRLTFVKDMTKALMSTTDPASGDADANYTPEVARTKANEMADKQFGAAGGGAATGPPSLGSAYSQLPPAQKVTVDESTAVLHALDTLLVKWGEKYEEAAYDPATGAPSADLASAWSDGPDLDIAHLNRRVGGKLSPKVEWSSVYSDKDSSGEAIEDFRNKIIGSGIPEQELWDVIKPHPAAMRAFGVRLPPLMSVTNSSGVSVQPQVWSYDPNASRNARWTKIRANDLSGNPLSTTAQQALRVGALIQGIDFDGTGAPLNP